ncbi:MAG: 3-methyl-2-oxobutanoate hydroxymethyltransferase [Candidatus Krumholzibacteriia bacterium]|nr:3-methyl-2-oxobutanoate hydroxymethyltransferase [Candidatus Latescibacterota bacterium]
MATKKVGTRTLAAMKARGEKIVALTAYDHPSARILDACGVDIVLVGDSAANVVLGYDSTLPVTMEEMLVLVAAVARGAQRAMVVADLPFMSYQVSTAQALENAGRFVKTAGAEAVKLEGGRRSSPAVEAIVAAGIPVMGHLGLTPQSHLAFGGFRVQGREEAAADALVDDALALEAAGAFAVVLEGMPWTLAQRISERLRIPTIGIGAGERCDGQILVLHDMLGYGEGGLTFVKRFAEIERDVSGAVTRYCEDVRAGRFPAEEHRFAPGNPKPRARGRGRDEAGG